MSNEKGMNGSNGAGNAVQVNPMECAQVALMFLARADFKRHERQSFDMAEAMLQAIASGHVVLAPAPEKQQPLPLEPVAPPA